MILYLLKSGVCLLLLWGFYRLFLEGEKMHYFKRFYLLFSLVFSCTIPLITFTYVTYAKQEIVVDIDEPITAATSSYDAIYFQDTETAPVNYIAIILWCLYGFGVLIFGFRFIKNINSLYQKINENEKQIEPSHIHVLLTNAIVPHTFLKYIFVSKKDFKQQTIPEEVLLHEKTHVIQKHTIDILLVEVLQIAFWFNPVFVLIKRAIRLNHEFLADQNVLKQRFSIQNYFNLLINYPSSSNQAVLTSPINYSLTKKRLQMMTTKFSKKRVAVKLFAFIPVFILCLLFFNHKIVAHEIEDSFTEVMPYNTSEPVAEESLIVILKDTKEEEKEQEEKAGAPSFQDGVTKEDFEAYNIWAKDATDQIENNTQIRITDYSRMKAIYDAMNPEQRTKAEAFPNLPEPPPVPEAPKVNKGEMSIIPPPPPVPAPPSPPEIEAYEFESEIEEMEGFEDEKIAMLAEIESAIEEAEAMQVSKGEYHESIKVRQQAAAAKKMARVRAREAIMAEMARARAEKAMTREQVARAKGQAEVAREMARVHAEEARAMAEMTRVHAEEARAMTREQGERVKEQAMRVGEMARKQAELARKRGQEEAIRIREIAREVAQSAMESARGIQHEERQNYDGNIKKYEKKARKAEKELEKAEKKRREALRNLLEMQLKAQQSEKG